MSKYPPEIMLGFSFDGENPTYKAFMLLLNESIESEVAAALSKENKGEDRAWYAGRAEALASFRSIVSNIRLEVAADNGIKVDESSSNGSGR